MDLTLESALATAEEHIERINAQSESKTYNALEHAEESKEMTE